MLRPLGFIFAFLAIFVMAGGHLGTVQVFAWARMAVEYSHKDGLQRGLANTFDGKHLCPLCMKVQQAKKAEQKAPADFADAKKKSDPCTFGANGLDFSPLGQVFRWPHGDARLAKVRADQPLVPPPLALFS